jgi:amino acid adenylation domain-containing protein
VATQDQTIISIKQLKSLTGSNCTLQSIYKKVNIKAGTQLTIPEDNVWESYKKQSETLSKYESFWVKEWKHFKPAVFPFLEVTSKTIEEDATHNIAATFKLSDNLKQALSLAFPKTKACELLLSLLILYLYRLGNDEALGVALHQSSTYPFSNAYPSLIANSVPFNVTLDHEMDFDKVLKSIQSQLQKLNQKKTYLRDIFSRYPNIQSVSHPVIAISLEPEEKSSPTILDSPLTICIHQQEIFFLIAQKLLNNNLQLIFSNVAEHLQILLENIVQNHKEKPIVHMPLLTTRECNKLLEWNDTQTDYPRNKTIHQLFEEQVEKTPDNICLIFKEKAYTYRQLNKKANQIAYYLQKTGVTVETLVAICLGRSLEMIISMLAILKAGGTYICIASDSTKERIEYIVQNIKPKITILQTKLGLSCSELEINKLLKNETTYVKTDSIVSFSHADNIACVIYTSGSTGSPKGVEITHKGVARLVKNTNYINLNEKDTIAQTSYEAFDATFFEIWGALTNGSKLVICDKNDLLNVKTFYKLLQENSINTLWLTSALFNQLVDIQPNLFCHLENLIIGGEPLNPRSIARLFKQKTRPKKILNGYGPTESTTFTTYYLIKEATLALNSIPIGAPIANTQVYVLDQHKQLVPIGTTGELYIGGDGLARGYLNQPTLTEEKFIPNPFYQKTDTDVSQSNIDVPRLYKTGDRARWLSDGNLEYLGRLDNQVKIRGFRIEIEEIEIKLNQHPLIEQAVIVVNVTDNQDKQLIAFIVEKMTGAPLTEPVTSETLQSFLKNYLPYYVIPSLFYKTETFPITSNGKLDRKKLAQLNWPCTALPISNSKTVLAETSVQKQLLKLWQKLSINKNLGIHHNFFFFRWRFYYSDAVGW